MSTTALEQFDTISEVCGSVIEELIEESPSWNLCYVIGTLSESIANRDLQYAKSEWKNLLKKYCGIETKNDIGKNPIFSAVLSPFMKLFKVVLSAGEDVTQMKSFEDNEIVLFVNEASLKNSLI